jgi:hypothetical protein
MSVVENDTVFLAYVSLDAETAKKMCGAHCG